MEGRIFISYSRRDLDVVNPIKEELESNGFSCWMDLDGIESGDESFARIIVPALDNCMVVLFFISANSQNSDWVAKELGYAKRHEKRVVPLRFNDDALVGEFDFNFGGANIIDWRKREQKWKLLRDLRIWADAANESPEKRPPVVVPTDSPDSTERQSESSDDFLALEKPFKVYRQLLAQSAQKSEKGDQQLAEWLRGRQAELRDLTRNLGAADVGALEHFFVTVKEKRGGRRAEDFFSATDRIVELNASLPGKGGRVWQAIKDSIGK